MAKLTKPRKDSLNNPRSRAARRATSPSLNTDKSLKEAPRASDGSNVLAPYRGAGIQKKQKKKQLSHGQRVRHEKGQERAEAIRARHEAKVADAKARLRRRQGRRALWDEVNDTTKEETRKSIKAPGRFDTLDDESEEEPTDAIQPFHGDTEIKVIDGVLVPSFATGQPMTFTLGPTMPTNTQKPKPEPESQPQPEPQLAAELESQPEAESVDEIT